MRERRGAGTSMTRRRCLSVMAVGAAGALLRPGSGVARESQRFEWTGVALGAPARLVLHHWSEDFARDAISAVLDEVERLEREFSLFRTDSALNRLNAEGRLYAPSADMIAVLGVARAVSEISGGAFDVSVQPLWRLYSEHFAKPDPAPSGPSDAALADVLKRIGCRGIALAEGAVRLRPGMAVTLNGVAQGYVTDRVAALLRQRGWRNVLIDMGELRALDERPDGSPFSIRLAHGEKRVDVVLENAAIATSSGLATRFTGDGRFHHLIDPRTGRPSQSWRAVSVRAANAALADALSTALSIASPEEAERIFRRSGALEAWLTSSDGRTHRMEAA